MNHHYRIREIFMRLGPLLKVRMSSYRYGAQYVSDGCVVQWSYVQSYGPGAGTSPLWSWAHHYSQYGRSDRLSPGGIHWGGTESLQLMSYWCSSLAPWLGPIKRAVAASGSSRVVTRYNFFHWGSLITRRCRYSIPAIVPLCFSSCYAFRVIFMRRLFGRR